MKKTITSILSTSFLLVTGLLNAQTFTESMGTVGSTTSVSNHETANGFDNDAFTMTGNADVRSSSASSGYTGASGGANIYFSNSAGEKIFVISGINASNLSNIALSFGISKNTNAATGADFFVEYSTNGTTYTALNWGTLPTGTGSAGWYSRSVTTGIPSSATLSLRFRTSASVSAQYRLDDLNLTACQSPVVSISSSAPNATLCESGGNAATVLTADVTGSGAYSYQWQYQDNNSNWLNITGSVSASGSATAPFTVSQNASPSATRSYRVVVTQGTCSSSASQLVTVVPDPVLSLTSTNITCFGDNNGTASGSLTGGTAGNTYSFNWAPGTPNGDGTLNINNLSPGTYSLTVSGQWGCNATGSVTITEPTKVNISASNTAILCYGGTSVVTVNTWGGTTPYSLNDAGTYTVNAGSYTYSVSDANGCSASTSLNITEPTAVVASISATPILCNGGTSVITVSGQGGTGALSGTGSFTVTAGTYSYTVTDANGCSDDVSITVTEPTVLTSSVSGSDYNGYGVSCFGSTDGSADLTVSGGTPGYSYSWSNGASSEDLSGIGAGTYNVIVTDANGCTTDNGLILAEPTKVNISATNTSIACFGQNSDVTVTTSGGVTPYSIDDAGTYSVPAGNYTYDVVDANGCSASTTIDITQPALLTVNAGSDETVFFGYGPMECADLDATINGGTQAYNVVWTSTASGGGIGASYTACPTSNEVYTVSVVDANGCTATDELSICVVDVICYAGNSSIQKVQMCQVPPGNPANAHTICIDASAVPAHLAIGCQLGECGELAAACSGSAAKSLETEELAAALVAYPNPSENTTTISVTLTKGGNYSVEMFDMMGKLVKTVYAGSFEDYENLEFDVDMTNLQTGVYMISVSNGDQKIENIRVMKN